MKNKALLNIIEQAARMNGQTISRERLDDIRDALGGNSVDANAVEIAATAWKAAGLAGAPAGLAKAEPQDCPFLAWDSGWFVVLAQKADGGWVVQNEQGETARKMSLDAAECVALPQMTAAERAPLKAMQLGWSAIRKRTGLYLDALLATFLVNTLALATSLYSMQVYDRVIPNKGFQTLWVLSVGVAIAVLLELLLKHVRGSTVEKAAMAVDAELTEWLFQRMLGIRLDCRPPSVGTLAAQIKGMESVRGVLSSTSLFVLADVPFALLFCLVIFVVGGWLAIIPAILLPLSILTGVMFQNQIVRHTRENQGQSNLKTGLLVEAVDGAESLKANGAEWKLLARFKRLAAEAAASDYKVKHYSALSQHLTGTTQQVGYIVMVALGAYLVTENHLTMGGLIACTIIVGRALAPVAQLPAIMVQWAQARAATEGLDKLIALPNEIDDRATGLRPGVLENGFRFHSVAFNYGAQDGVSFAAEKLEIKPGEKVGIIGSVGSGKSTLLKLASGMYRPTAGKVFLGGIDMSTVSPTVLREMVAYLPQDARLVSGTLRDNLLQGLPDPGDERLLEAARASGLIDLIASHPQGMTRPITEGGRGVSGGQRQLIALTRLLLSEPKVMLLDEPTAPMDASTESKIISVMQARAATGITLLVATHKSAWLQAVDRLLVVQDGKVTIDGPRDAVLAYLAGAPQLAAGQAPETLHKAA